MKEPNKHKLKLTQINYHSKVLLQSRNRAYYISFTRRNECFTTWLPSNQAVAATSKTALFHLSFPNAFEAEQDASAVNVRSKFNPEKHKLIHENLLKQSPGRVYG